MTARRTRGGAAAAACVALAWPLSASGHVTVAPPFVEAGVATAVRFEVPNERRGHATTAVSAAAPANVRLGIDRQPAGSWTARSTGDAVHWSGGRIDDGATVRFPVVVTARTPPGQVAFRVVQRYDDGRRVVWRAALTVVPGPEPAESPDQHLGRALTGAAVGLIVIAASLLALRRLRRRSALQER